MKKLLIVLIAAVVLTPVEGLGAEPPAKPEARPEVHKNDKVVLRESVVVKSKLVRLGDLFSNTGAKADITVAYAPAPGKRALFDARWLSRVARAYGLDWRPLGPQDQIMVERESQIITRAEIEDSIHAALISQGAERSMTVELSNRLLRLYVASGSPRHRRRRGRSLRAAHGAFHGHRRGPRARPPSDKDTGDRPPCQDYGSAGPEQADAAQ